MLIISQCQIINLHERFFHTIFTEASSTGNLYSISQDHLAAKTLQISGIDNFL